MSRSAAATVLAFLAATALLVAAASGPAAAAASANANSFDSTHYEVTVYANGSARWTFTYQTVLHNDTQKQAFQNYSKRFEHNDTHLYSSFRARARNLTADGANVTGRNMSASHFSRAAHVRGRLSDNLGVLTMSFTWQGFAQTDGDRVVVGDLFDGGLYVASDQRFVVSPGPGLRFASAAPQPDATAGQTLAESDSVTWRGKRSFTDQHPRIVLTSVNTTGGSGGGTTTGRLSTSRQTGNATTGSDTTNGGLPLGWLAGGFLAGALVGGGGALAYTRTRDDATPGHDTSNPDNSTTAGTNAPSTEPAVTDAEMLTDEQRVTDLLEDHGGRMRQVSIVDETDWSKSKVSMLLSDMEDDDQITRLRVGRENVVSLPGHEPTAAQDSRPDPDDDGDADA